MTANRNAQSIFEQFTGWQKWRDFPSSALLKSKRFQLKPRPLTRSPDPAGASPSDPHYTLTPHSLFDLPTLEEVYVSVCVSHVRMKLLDSSDFLLTYSCRVLYIYKADYVDKIVLKSSRVTELLGLCRTRENIGLFQTIPHQPNTQYGTQT